MTNFIKFEMFPLIMAFLGNALFDEAVLKLVFTALGVVIGNLLVRLVNKYLDK